tara:strand:- start:2605 stop:2847 length:243 start_codon:yes stop_codon:yes gene_type:complete
MKKQKIKELKKKSFIKIILIFLLLKKKIAIKEKKKFQSHLQKEYIKEVLTKVIHGLYLPLLLGKQIQLIKKDILFYNNLI